MPTVTTSIPRPFKPDFANLFGGAQQAAQRAAQSTGAGSEPRFVPFGLQGDPKGIPPQGFAFDPASARQLTPQELLQNDAARRQAAKVLGLRPQELDVGTAEVFLTPDGTYAIRDPSQDLVGAPFGGGFLAQANPLELLGLSDRAALSEEFRGFHDPVLELGLAQARGDFLSPESNPFLQETINTALNPIFERFEETIRPALRSQAIEAGAFKGSSRRDIAEENAARDTQRLAAETAGLIAFENLARERQLQQQAAQRLDEAARLAQLPPELLVSSGAGFRQAEQLSLDEQLRQFEEGLIAPFRPLFPLASLIGGSNVGSTVSQPTPDAGLAGILQGILGGAATGGSLGSFAGPYGAIGGGILGALSGGFAGAS